MGVTTIIFSFNGIGDDFFMYLFTISKTVRINSKIDNSERPKNSPTNPPISDKKF